MTEILIGSGVVVVLAAILAYAMYHVLRLEKDSPTEELVPDETSE